MLQNQINTNLRLKAMKRIYKYMIGAVVFGATAFMSVPTVKACPSGTQPMYFIVSCSAEIGYPSECIPDSMRDNGEWLADVAIAVEKVYC
ncbi:MAG: hypothetical protein LBU91_02230 [Bacteroidales bacterium]|nr:hypothetical protein [Bacteroidales bacterium]